MATAATMERTSSGCLECCGGGAVPIERTFVAVKFDTQPACGSAASVGLVGEIIARLEGSGYHLVGMKMVHPSWEQAERHYAHLRASPSFKKLCVRFASSPIIAMVWEGADVVQGIRRLAAKKPPASPSTPADVCSHIAHTSESVEAGVREASFWFAGGELVAWAPAPPPAAVPNALQRKASTMKLPPATRRACPWSFDS